MTYANPPTADLWIGHEQEAEQFLSIVKRNCICSFNDLGSLQHECQLHHDLRENPRLIRGLLFGRARAAQFQREESTTVVLWQTRIAAT